MYFLSPIVIILCLGVLKYGVGTWEEAKADLELELNIKILPTSDDTTPQVNSFSIRRNFDLFHSLIITL